MGFSDNCSKMSDLNLLPKKHTNFSIERILLKQTAASPSDGSGAPTTMSHSPQPQFELLEQKVDLTVKTCLKIVQSATDHRTAAGSTSACTVTSKNVIPLATAGDTGTSIVAPSSQTLLLAGPHRPLNRVLDNPWCSRGPLMFDPKLISGPGPAASFGGGTPHKPAHSSRGAVGDAALGLLGPVTPPSPSSAASPSLASSSSPSSSLIKAEVERKVVLSAYANNSVIERNRLSINYPYPVGLFNAYASAAAVAAAAAATVSSVHQYQHHNQQQRMTPSAPPDALLAAGTASASIGISMQQQQQQQHNQPHPRAASLSAAAILAGSGTAPLHAASAALFNSFYQLQKSDENQNSIFDQVSGEDEGASDGGTTVTSGDGGKDSKTDLFHAHHLHHHHHHLHHHHEPGSAGAAAATGTLCTLMFPECSYQCAICDKIFGNQDTLMTHEKSHKTPRFECEECGKGFSQLRNYKYHVSVHRGTKEFAAKCPECGKMFNDKGYLSSHLKIHRNKKEYSCPHCPKSFNQRVAFNMHVRIHTGVKPHKCNECGKRFSRKMLLKQHLRTHSGEKPYQCSVCGKSFADRSNMTLHHRLHSGIKPFACPICPKAFTKKHHLKTHLNYHTGYKPYKCPHPNCGQSFTQSSNMRTHAKKCQFKPPDSEFV
ncbi:zinc finger and SCAN domain-containing protein 2 [Anopheles gambiae]|uniref:zinc finger and SCAN domain-containing protein 2 n=1 Tax=Anopheles gambiae TaxID=7165 RepID=UPI001AAD9E0E|nr:zinc finger and SCAN domain-containing protein 2 [Anopheles gambiae]